MSEIWIEKPDGYFYPKNAELSPAIWAKLKILTVENLAEDRIYGIFIAFEKSVHFSDEDAELLNFPPKNPYRLSIRTSGILGKSDFRYILEIMRPDGQNFINPTINGALLHIDSETIFRLNADQYELVRLTQDSNKNISILNRQQAMLHGFTSVCQIQKYAESTDAKLDKFISAENIKIVMPEGLDIKFQEISQDVFQVQPVLLSKSSDGNFAEVPTENFQETFDKRREVADVYMDKNRTRYIFPENVKRGLQQIKSVPKMNKADKERYSKQPRELFSDEVFHFSDRIIGIEEVAKNFYGGQNIYKTDWLGDVLGTDGQEYFSPNSAGNSDLKKSAEKFSDDKVEEENISKKIFALKIKPNLIFLKILFCQTLNFCNIRAKA